MSVRRKKMPPGAAEIAVFGMLGALMFASKLALSALPNVHLCGVFIVACTVVYRSRALYPIYVFVFLTGLFEGGFNAWWLPYLYIWLPLWALALLLPRRAPSWLLTSLSMLLGATHGILYGILYAPAQALFFKMDFQMTVAWVLSGTPFDILHAAGNLSACALTVPLVKLLLRLEKGFR